MIRVGKIYCSRGKDSFGSTPGYTNVIVKNYKTGLGSTLSPYFLKDEAGVIMENYYQASKAYSMVFAQEQYTSRFQQGDRRYLIWEHPEEVHLDEQGNPNAVYWAWRDKLMKASRPVRYPNGFHGRHTCKYAIIGTPDNYRKLDYITARKEIYCRVYADLIKKEPEFHVLQKMYREGKQLQILDVDGPVLDTHYPNNLVQNGSIEITEPIIKALLHDPKYPFGHGFVLAVCLMGKEEWLFV